MYQTQDILDVTSSEPSQSRKRLSVYDEGCAVWGLEIIVNDETFVEHDDFSVAKDEMSWDYIDIGSPLEVDSDSDIESESDDYLFVWDYHEMAPQATAWDCRGLHRTRVMHYVTSILQNGDVGDFIVRDRLAEPNTFALTIKVADNKYGTYAIIPCRENGKWRLRGDSKNTFKSVEELVKFFSARPRYEIGNIQLNLWTPKISLFHTNDMKFNPA